MDYKTYNKIIKDNKVVLSPDEDLDEIFGEENYNKYVINTINSETIKKLVRLELREDDIFYKEKYYVFLKIEKEKYRITPEDVICCFNNILKKKLNRNQTLEALNNVINPHNIIKKMFMPNFEKEDKNDYFFDDDDHLVIVSLNYVRNFIKNKLFPDFKIIIKNQIKFIKEILENRRFEYSKKKFSDSSLSLLISNMSIYTQCSDNKIKDDIINYFRNNLEYLVRKKDYEACYTYAYEHYLGGTLAYPDDIKICLKYLLYCFNKSKDPDIANTLGYIYYYGRNNNGIPEGDEAFKYFALSHFSIGKFESTYKLADCYIHGYGTPKSYQAAYNILLSIENETKNYVRSGDAFGTKYADVALRLGNFYKDGLFVKKNKRIALSYFLDARAAIKKRIENIDYVGDVGVANSINKNILELSNKEERQVNKEKGFIIDKMDLYNFADIRIKYLSCDNNGVYVQGTPLASSTEKYLFFNSTKLNMCLIERKLKFYIEIKNFDISKFKMTEKDITFTDIYRYLNKISFSYEYESGLRENKFDIKQITVFPNSSLDKIILAEVKFENSDKTYTYISKANVKAGEIRKVMVNNKIKNVIVTNTHCVYEDELPLPLKKMGQLLNN